MITLNRFIPAGRNIVDFLHMNVNMLFHGNSDDRPSIYVALQETYKTLDAKLQVSQKR